MKILALLAAIVSTAAVAAPPVTQAKPQPQVGREDIDPETLNAALALFEGPEIEQQLSAVTLQMANTMLQGQFDRLRAEGIEAPSDLVDRLRNAALEEVHAMVEAMKPDFRMDAALVYARYFTAAELRELKRINDLPVSRKAQSLLPTMTPEFMKIGMDKSAEREPVLQRRIMEIIESWVAEQRAAEGKKS